MKKKNKKRLDDLSGHDIMPLLEGLYACGPAKSYVLNNRDSHFRQIWDRCPEPAWKIWLVNKVTDYQEKVQYYDAWKIQKKESDRLYRVVVSEIVSGLPKRPSHDTRFYF